MDQADVVVIGAGIAGAGCACELAARHAVVVLEREAQPGYHTTGRSAALYTRTYGNRPMRALARASFAFLDAPPPGFAPTPLLGRRGTLLVARDDQRATLQALFDELGREVGDRGLAWLAGAVARELAPIFGPDQIAAAIHEPDAYDMDVHALHQGYLRQFRAHGGRIQTDAEVLALARERDGWRIATRAGELRAAIVVNAAGAWADEIGALAGAAPIGLVPKRRTAITFDPPPDADLARWPAVIDVDEQWYVKPEAGQLLASPADETPSAPCDAQPDEFDVAVVVDRLRRLTTLTVPRLRSRWAGLRSFVEDKTLVAGFDPRCAGFFWLAGQGGYGIQTAPAASRLAAALIEGRSLPDDLAAEGIAARDFAPHRLCHSAAFTST